MAFQKDRQERENERDRVKIKVNTILLSGLQTSLHFPDVRSRENLFTFPRKLFPFTFQNQISLTDFFLFNQ